MVEELLELKFHNLPQRLHNLTLRFLLKFLEKLQQHHLKIVAETMTWMEMDLLQQRRLRDIHQVL